MNQINEMIEAWVYGAKKEYFMHTTLMITF